MKVCPKCGAVAKDETQAFCLMDGAPLVDQSSSEPTVVMSHSEPTVTMTPATKKRRAGVWIFVILVGLIALGGVIGLLMFAAYRMGTESARIDINTAASPTPRSSATARSTPQPGASPPSSPVATTENRADVPGPDEPTPIAWTTAASTFKTDAGLTYTFQCPPDGMAGIAWGSDIYTADSSVCTAAVHAGKISLKQGGEVTIEFRSGRTTYGATTRNGITTHNFGQYPYSFVFK